MRVLVVGIGGVGGFIGAKLARAYHESLVHEVYFLARGNHLHAIREKGLTLVTQSGTFKVRPRAASDVVNGWPIMELVILCVKGYDLKGAAEAIKPSIGAETMILPLQNGIGKRDFIEGLIPHALVLDGTVYVFAHIQSPGTVVHIGGPGKVLLGGPKGMPPERLIEVEALLSGAQVDTEVASDIDVAIWKKFIVLAPIAGLTSLYRQTVGEILAQGSKVELLKAVMKEVIELAVASRVGLPQDAMEEGLKIVRAFPRDGKSSLLHDLEKGKTGELHWLLGRALEMGREIGLPMPNLKMVYEGIQKRWFGTPPQA